jgi:hypothetical protein
MLAIGFGWPGKAVAAQRHQAFDFLDPTSALGRLVSLRGHLLEDSLLFGAHADRLRDVLLLCFGTGCGATELEPVRSSAEMRLRWSRVSGGAAAMIFSM